MKVIVGLGNPGQEYENTRHNAGFLVLDALKTRMTNNQIPSTKYASNATSQIQNSNFQFNKRFDAEVCKVGDLLLVKPHTYMNESGRTVSAVVNYYKVDLADLWLVHDDLDIVMGEYKIQFEKGPKIHGGVNSIEEQLGGGEFWRIRIGVDNRGMKSTKGMESMEGQTSKKMPGRKYVLMKLNEDERKVLEGVVERVVGELIERLV